MPARLRPTAPIAAAAILVGDPGRALLLAQGVLEQPKMSNHARGLWGYFGTTADGVELTIQSTGMGGPSAVLVLEDLIALGVRRAVRVGTCAALAPELELGELVVVGAAIAGGGSIAPLGLEVGATVRPHTELSERLLAALEPHHTAATVLSVDSDPAREQPRRGVAAADMQTAPLLAAASALGVAGAALLVVAEKAGESRPLDIEALASAERVAGDAAVGALSP